MKLAIQELLLSGGSIHERMAQAKVLGFDGIEIQAEGLTPNIPAIAETLSSTGLEISAVNIGGTHLLHPDYAARDQAIVSIRQAMANVLDLGAEGVIITSHHPTTPHLPDLHPYKSSIELQAELLATQLRATLCDLAYAMGAVIYLSPQNHYETHLLQRLEHAAAILQKNDNHPHAKIAANTFHMAMEEDDPLAALRDHMAYIEYIQLADHNHRLPGHGMINFAAVLSVLKAAGYDGWLTIACGSTGHHTLNAHDMMRDLPACIAMLRQHIGK